MLQDFREMRRFNKAFTPQQCRDLLLKGTTRHWAGLLGVHGENGYPYVVPVDYIYDGEHLWFHSAMAGLKIESIRRDPKVCMTVVAKDDRGNETYMLTPEEEYARGNSDDYTCHFGSVIIYGRARIVTDEAERYTALELLARQRTPEYYARGLKEIEMHAKGCYVIAVDIDHMTGKGI